MTTKSWTKISNMLSSVLSETLDQKTTDNIMSTWNAKKTEVSKLIGTTGRSKHKKDPNAPRRANTSYILFCGDQREKVKKSNPNMSATEITTKLGELWKALSEKDKKKYTDLAAKDKARYEQEMESYVPPPEDELEEKTKRGRGKKERTGPKRPLTAYMLFCQDKRPEVKDSNPNMNGTEITTKLGELWKALSEKDKAPYVARQATDKSRYETEKASLTPDAAAPAKSRGKKEETKTAPKKEETKSTKSSKKEETKTAPKKEEAKPVAKETKPAKKEEAKPAPKKEEAKPAAKDAKPSKKEEAKPAAKSSKKEEAKPAPKKEDTKSKKTDDVKKTPGYEYFLKEQSEELESEYPDWGSRKIQAEVSKLWKELDDGDREAYEEEAQLGEDGSELELEDD